MNVAIVTARAGCKSILDKNVLPVAGRPMVHYPIAGRPGRVPGRRGLGLDRRRGHRRRVRATLGAKMIPRPRRARRRLRSTTASSSARGRLRRRPGRGPRERRPAARQHGLYRRRDHRPRLALLDERRDLDSVMTVWEAADDHPLPRAPDQRRRPDRDLRRPAPGLDRAPELPQGLLLRPGRLGLPQGAASDRRTGPTRGGGWASASHPIVRPWVTGRDIHGLIDVFFSEQWVGHPDIVQRIKEEEH